MKFQVDLDLDRLLVVREEFEMRRQELVRKGCNQSQIDSLSNTLDWLDTEWLEIKCLSRVFEILFLKQPQIHHSFCEAITGLTDQLLSCIPDSHNEYWSGLDEFGRTRIRSAKTKLNQLLGDLMSSYSAEMLSLYRSNQDNKSRMELLSALHLSCDLLQTMIKFHESELRQWTARANQCPLGSSLKELCLKRGSMHERLKAYAIQALEIQEKLKQMLETS